MKFHNPVVLLKDEILDGRNRYRACTKISVEPKYKQFEGDDPLAFVLSENLHRRHLTISQRAALAVEVANMTQSDAAHNTNVKLGRSDEIVQAISNKEASELFQVGTTSIKEAKAIKRDAPERFEELRKGEKTIQQIKRELTPPSQPEFDENIKTEQQCPKCGYEW